MAVQLRDPKNLLLAAMRGWVDLLALLGPAADTDKVNLIFPNAKRVLDSNTPVPFLAVLQEDAPNVDDIVSSTSFGLWVYDVPEESYWRIDRIHRVLRKRMSGLELGVTADGILDPFQFEFKSGEARDDDLAKLVKFARYRTWLVT